MRSCLDTAIRPGSEGPVPTGTDFVTVRLTHPARNRLPRDFIRRALRRPTFRNTGGQGHEGLATGAGGSYQGHRSLQD